MARVFHKDTTSNPGVNTRFAAYDVEKDENGWPQGFPYAAHVDLQHERENVLRQPGRVSSRFNDVDGYGAPSDTPTQGTFLQHTPAEIRGAFADPTMTSAVPTLLGMAANANLRAVGQLPTHAHSLSKHSSSMVQKLRERGAPIPTNPDNPLALQTNNIAESGIPRYQVSLYDMQGAPADPAEVKAGRALSRQFLRKPAVPMADDAPAPIQGRLF